MRSEQFKSLIESKVFDTSYFYNLLKHFLNLGKRTICLFENIVRGFTNGLLLDQNITNNENNV